MPKQTLTNAGINALPAPEKGQTDYSDAKTPGLVMRVSQGGSKTWLLRYRASGSHRRFKLGTYPALSLAEARKEATKARARVLGGHDPQRERDKARAAAKPLALGEAITEYDKRHLQSLNSGAIVRRQLEMYLKPALGRLPLVDVTRGDVLRAIDAVPQPGAANGAFKAARSLFNWAVSRDYLTSNPLAGVKMPHKLKARERALSDAEMRTVWAAADRMGYPFGAYVKLLALTGQRRSEVARMKRAEIDGGIWTIPRENTKNDRTQMVPLSPAALAVLDDMPKFKGPHMFTSGDGKKPISGFAKAKQRLDSIAARLVAEGYAPVASWRLHDLRRTVATGMAADETPPHVIEATLNHAESAMSGLARVYNRHAYLPEKRAALNAWADRLLGLVETGPADVVDLKARTAN